MKGCCHKCEVSEFVQLCMLMTAGRQRRAGRFSGGSAVTSCFRPSFPVSTYVLNKSHFSTTTHISCRSDTFGLQFRQDVSSAIQPVSLEIEALDVGDSKLCIELSDLLVDMERSSIMT